MESKNHKIIKNFITKSEVNDILKWTKDISHIGSASNEHLSALGKSLKGKTKIFDISKTHITNYITNFQSTSDPDTGELPILIENIINRISTVVEIPSDNIFLQVVDMNKGGKIDPHYDASVDGYINYKCNISVLSEDYDIYIGDDKLTIQSTDLYCFESSLYKHWTKEFNSKRILLSFGFMIPYSLMNRDESDARVRMSKRIRKYLQDK